MPVCVTAAVLLALAAPPQIDHVIVISVDGLRPDAIQGPAAPALTAFPRLLRGPHTLEARTDADTSVTLPNHVSMVTGRPVSGPNGHGWTENVDPRAVRDGGTLHLRAGKYISSMFDVAHDHGVRTAVVSTKTKFWLLEQTYDEDNGGNDTIGADDGKDKIDIYSNAITSRLARESAWAVLAAHPARSLMLVHFAAPDLAGHATGWDMKAGSPYLASVQDVDHELDALLASIDADPALRGRVAIVLTADHGGGVPFLSHVDQRAPEDYLIPFVVWNGADGPSIDLAAVNADRRAVVPRTKYLGTDTSPQPIRNAEAGNLALQILGLPAIPGSVADSKQDLRLAPPTDRPTGAHGS